MQATLRSRYVWTQDRARCYMEKKVWQYCKTTFKDFGLPDFSLPSNPFLYLLDIAGYGVFGAFLTTKPVT